MMEAPTERDARHALETFREEFAAKYPKAVDKLDRDWKHLTAFYAFPAEALAPPADHEPDRKQLRDGQAAHPRHQGRRLQGRAARNGVQAAQGRREPVATLQRPRARRRRARRRELQRRDPGPRRAPRPARREGRRLNLTSGPDPQLLTIAPFSLY